MGKGRPRFGEGGGSDGEVTVVCIASLGKGLLDLPEDGSSAD